MVWLWFALALSALVFVSMARLWTDTSMPRLEGAEAALLRAYGKVWCCLRAPFVCVTMGVWMFHFLPVAVVWCVLFSVFGHAYHSERVDICMLLPVMHSQTSSLFFFINSFSGLPPCPRTHSQQAELYFVL